MATNSDLIGYFNNLSETYTTNEYASFFMTNYMRRKLIRKVQSYKNKSVLDIMSGKGENIKYLTQNDTSTISTIDFSNKMNEAARLNYKNKKVHQIEDNFFDMNYTAESFDVILCSFGIKTIEPEKFNAFSKKINYLLKPNGEILLLEIVKPKHYLNYKLTKFYLDVFMPNVFGTQFRALFPYVNKHTSMDDLKLSMTNENIKILEHQRVFDLFEIIHAKKL